MEGASAGVASLARQNSVMNHLAVLEATISDAKSRWDDGDAPDAGKVLFEHPELSDRKSLVLELAYEEFYRRREAGDDIDVESFCERFPVCRASLRRRIEVEQFFDSNLDWLEASDWPEPGQSFGRFQLVRQIGQGVASRVFLAQQTDLGNRLVVLKLSLYGFTEAKVLSRLDHPNIMPIYSVEEDDSSGLVAICMPYLTPWTLLDFLDAAYRDGKVPKRFCEVLQQMDEDTSCEPPTGEEAPMPAWLKRASFVDGVLHLMGQVTDALRHTHERGILHLDLKPTNILITRCGRPLLLDFNLSADAAVQTAFGGTPPYMSPEQLQTLSMEGDAAETGGAKGEGVHGASRRSGGVHNDDRPRIDARSDIFSLGVVLYELLAGRHPFGRIEQRQASRRIAHELLLRQQLQTAPLVQLNATVGPSLSGLVRQCMAPDVTERPATAQQLGAKLKRHLAAPRRVVRWAQSHPLPVAAMLLGLLLVVGSLAFAQATRPPEHARLSAQGLALMEQGKWRDAVATFDSAVSKRPNVAALWLARGRARQAGGDCAAAIDDYQEAIAIKPEGKYFAAIGFCKAMLGKYGSAIFNFKQAKDHGFDSAELEVSLGRCHFMQGEDGDAWKCYDRARTINQQLGPAYHGLANVEARSPQAKRKPDAAGAVENIGLAIQYGPRCVDLFLDAARIHYAVEARAAAPRSFDRTFEHLTSAAEAGCASEQLESWLHVPEICNDKRLSDLLQHPKLGTAGTSAQDYLLDPLGADPVGDLRATLSSSD